MHRSFRSASIVLASLIACASLAGCQSGSSSAAPTPSPAPAEARREQPGAPAAPRANGDQAAAGRAADKPGAFGLPEEATAKCSGALRELQNGAAIGVLARCSDLFPGCAAAWTGMASAPPAPGQPFASCRDAYCPSLTGDRPALCDGRAIGTDAAPDELGKLLGAILVHEHHADAATANRLGDVFATFLVPHRQVPLDAAGHEGHGH